MVKTRRRQRQLAEVIGAACDRLPEGWVLSISKLGWRRWSGALAGCDDDGAGVPKAFDYHAQGGGPSAVLKTLLAEYGQTHCHLQAFEIRYGAECDTVAEYTAERALDGWLRQSGCRSVEDYAAKNGGETVTVGPPLHHEHVLDYHDEETGERKTETVREALGSARRGGLLVSSVDG